MQNKNTWKFKESFQPEHGFENVVSTMKRVKNIRHCKAEMKFIIEMGPMGTVVRCRECRTKH